MKMSTEEIAVYHLLSVWMQYGEYNYTDNGIEHLSHRNMSAGEDAAEWLESLGYAIDEGYSITLTEKATQLLELGEAIL
jgi:hypothetical protein